VPYAQKGSIVKSALFYQSNLTGFLQEYNDLGEGIIVNYYSSPSMKSKACEITFKDSISPNEEKKYGLYYELNTKNQKQYSELLGNYSGITIDYENKHYYADETIKDYEAQSYYSIKSSYVLSKKNCMINLKVWTYE
jgi:hypothetical protein